MKTSILASLTLLLGASALQAATVILSDSFNRANGITASAGVPRADSIGHTDNAYGGNGTLYYYEPIEPLNGTDATHPIGASLTNNVLVQNGLDLGGIQFTTNSNTGAAFGSDLGQNLYMAADLYAPSSGTNNTWASLYFRSRSAFSGDGIFGGTSSGYLVSLESTGQVRVQNLFNEVTYETTNGGNPIVTATPGSFNNTVFHHLELAASGTTLQVALDHVIQTFSQNGSVTTVSIPADGGSNGGTAGIEFDARNNRGLIGGQEADNIVITTYQPIVVPEPAGMGLFGLGAIGCGLVRRRR